MVFRSTLGLAMFLFSWSLQAADATPAARTLALAALDQESLGTPIGRANLIKAVSAYCDEIQSIYPRNSPSEDQWLDGEIAGGGNRVEKILSSPELGRRVTRIFADSCVASASGAVKRPAESYYFIALSYTFMRFAGDASYYAKKNGIDPQTYSLEVMPRGAAEALAYAAMMIEAQDLQNK